MMRVNDGKGGRMQNGGISDGDQGLPAVDRGNADKKIMLHGSFAHWLATVLIGAAISAAAVLTYDLFFAVKVVAVDLKGFIAQQRDLVLTKKITEEQFKANVDKFERMVFGIPENHVVIMGDAVVRNAPVVNIAGK
jgi:hypothetical protein